MPDETDQAVAEADIAVTRMSFRYFEDHPHFISMLNTENLHGARILKKIRQMHFPLVELIADILKRGQAAGIMREDVNPIQLYISIASLGYFYFSNYATLSTIFERDLLAEDTVVEREMHVIDMVMAFLAPDTRKVELLPSEALRPACRGW